MNLRQLRIGLSTKYLEQPDGSLLIPNIKLLAAGTWTDSAVQTPLFYPVETLRQYAANWKDTTLWSRHSGGSPRDITDKIGNILNPHFEGDAVVGDLWLHRKTQQSQDVAELIKTYIHTDTPLFVSVEHGGEEVLNPATRQYEASSLVFVGCAVVNQGACRKCRINEEPNMDENPLENQIKELSSALASKDARITELEGAVKELSESTKTETAIKELESKIPDVSSLESKLKELSELVTKQEKRIKELESQPAPKTDASAVGEYDYSSPFVMDSEGITLRGY